MKDRQISALAHTLCLERSKVASLICATDGSIIWMNAAYCTAGLDADAMREISLPEMLCPKDRALVRSNLQALEAGDQLKIRAEVHVVGAQNSKLIFDRIDFSLVADPTTRQNFVVAEFGLTDPAKTTLDSLTLEATSRRLKLALQASRVGIWELNLKTNFSFWDQRVLDMFEVSGDPDLPMSEHIFQDMLHPEDAERVISKINKAVEEETGLDLDFRIVTPNGRTKHIQASCLYHETEKGKPMLLGVDRDVTREALAAAQMQQTTEELKKAHLRAKQKNADLAQAHDLVQHNSLHDELTGLPNRRYLDKKLSGHAPDQTTAMLHIDLDRFKQINDTMGHAAGDAVLVHAATILRDNTAQSDFVARVGGDEFVIFVDQKISDDGLASLARRIVELLSTPYDYQGQECRFGVSIGIATQAKSDSDMDQLLINADIAMYRAKDRGRNRFEFFTRALHTEMLNNKRRADEILTGLESDEFILHYQPQFDANTGDIVCVEALARWQHPREGLLFPNAFLSIAKDLSVVDQIDHVSFTRSVADHARWTHMGLDIPKVSINVSSQRLHDDSLISSLEAIEFKRDTLSFELLESIFIDQNDAIATWNIDRIKDLGIEIDVDDFGSGHASILGLVNLRPRRLKIDRQLVIPITRSKQRCELVKSIIEIGKSLGIHVVAEGVETAEHVEILRALGCDTLQGYYFARPMSAGALEQFVLDQRWREAS